MQMANFVVADTGEGKKFSRNGEAQFFPGNTILCHLDTKASATLESVADVLRKKFGDDFISWLPSSSFHVTLLDVSLEARRHKLYWPSELSLDASLEECNDFVANKLHSFDLGIDAPFKLVADEHINVPTITMIPLRPVDSYEETRLRNLRDRLAKVLGIRHANHERYTFHSTFGYYVNEFPDSLLPTYQESLLTAIHDFKKKHPIIELGAPEFCTFEDMTKFETQFFLKKFD